MDYNIGLDRRTPNHTPKKWRCPTCGKKKYVRYINFDTFEYLPYEFGRCDREDNCKYFNWPDSIYFESLRANEIYVPQPSFKKNYSDTSPSVRQAYPQFSTIPHDKFEASLKHYNNNMFFLFLAHKFGQKWAQKLAKLYHLGTSKRWPGANIFWQIDEHGLVRTGKIMLYDPKTCKRSKYHLSFVHTYLDNKHYNLKQCFFGQHLLPLRDKNCKIAIVESEKTAMIANYFFRDYIWLATGGKTLLNESKCEVLQDREVVFFPDLSDTARKLWTNISNTVNLRYNIKSVVSDFDENINDGSDIADFLLEKLPIDKVFGNVLNEEGYPDFWDP